MLQVINLNKAYDGNVVLNNINFDVKKGEFISLIGSFGCGKTTLIRCINFLEIPEKCNIKCDDIEIDFNNELKNKSKFTSKKIEDDPKKIDFADYLEPIVKQNIFKLRQKIGFLFQELNLFPHLNVLKNISIALEKVKKLSSFEAENIAVENLKKVGLQSYLNRYPHELSAGQRQRTAIARALAMNPTIMLYDEPTSALDPKLVNEISSIIRDLSIEGMTQLVITHSVTLSKNFSDRVMFMDKGEIVESGTPEKIFSTPKDNRTKNYLEIFG